MTLTKPYEATFQVGDGKTKDFPFFFDEVSENFIRVIIKRADGSIYCPAFSVDMELLRVVFGEDEITPTSDDIICIYRDTPAIQDTQFNTLQGYNAKALENILSKIVAMIQEMKASGFSTQILQGEPWGLDLIKPADDGASVQIDYQARVLKKGLYFKMSDGNLQASANGVDFVQMPKSAEVKEFRHRLDSDGNVHFEYRVDKDWIGLTGTAETYDRQYIDNQVTRINAEIDANADAIQKTREDYINADSEIHQILNTHADELTTLRGNQASLGDQVAGIEQKIPESASGSNPLVTKQQLLEEEMDIRDDVNEMVGELQTQITAQAAAIAGKQEKLIAGDNIVIGADGKTISATGAGGGTGFDAIVVQELPATGQKGVIYLVSKGGQTPDIYNEYVWITATKTFELIGSTQVDLTNYATKNELNAKQDKLTAAGTSSLPVYYDGTRLKETTRLRAEMVSGGLDGEIYYAHHPEMNNMHILPFIYNDFAFIDKKGGSYTVTRSDNGEITRPEFIFDAAPSYMLSRGFSSDTVWTVEISTPTNFTYSTLLYVDFGTPGFACKYIKVEAQHSVTGEWKTVLEKTDNVLSYVYCKCASDDVGVNKFRFTFKNPLSTVQFRISSIGAISFKSSGIEETVLTLKGGTVFGDVIAPNITNIQNALGGKVNIAQGAENAGKILKVDDSGNVVVGEGGGASLPDQTGNAGKFLTTDGTVASWGGNDIIRNKAKESYFNSTVAIGTPIASYTSACISITGSDGDAASGAVVLGSKAKAKAVNSIVIGRYATNTSDAKGSITLNAATKSSTASNTEPNTFKIGNDNGLFTMMSDDGKIPLERLTKVTDQIAESVNTKDLTVGTDEGTLNLSITAGVATIATNNGLDIVAQTKFDTAPTTDDTTTWADALDTSFIRKAQAATALSGKVDITQGAENANKILKANRVGVLEPSYAENLAVRYGSYLWVGDNTGASYFTSKEIPTVGESLGGSYTVGAVSNNSINVYKGGSSYETATRNSSGDVIEYGTESLSDKADKSLSNIDYSGKTAIANISMPSERRIDLVLGSNGSEYTAPADGYYVVGKVNGTTAQRFIQLKNITTQVISRSFAPYESNNTFVFVPCRKGDVVTASYDMTGETTYFYFVYAEGSKHLG